MTKEAMKELLQKEMCTKLGCASECPFIDGTTSKHCAESEMADPCMYSNYVDYAILKESGCRPY